MTECTNPEIYREILERLPFGIYVVDRDRKILIWNDGAENLTGYKRHEVVGRNCQDDILEHRDEDNRVLNGDHSPLAETIRDGKSREAIVYLRHKEGERSPARTRTVPVRDESGSIVVAAETFEEVVTNADELIPFKPVKDRFDMATGLPDRQSMEVHLRQNLERWRKTAVPFAVFSIVIDDLDRIQDSRGRNAAEAVLGVAARTLQKNLRPADAVGLWEGNRLMAIATHCPAVVLSNVAVRLKRIVDSSSVPWWGDRIAFSISVGGAGVMEDDTMETIMCRAEETLWGALADRCA